MKKKIRKPLTDAQREAARRQMAARASLFGERSEEHLEAHVLALRWAADKWRREYPLNKHAVEWANELDRLAVGVESGKLQVAQ